ncbi:MAG: chromosomal replication initiator protein DnaA [FCB group bacterium]|jgi:chromosomal replication initiator protein|nr:chromosomal replication initiator protein DnaA [FCB group bacterium]
MAFDDANPWILAQPRLQAILDEHTYKNWFSQTRFESYLEGELVVGVPSEFFATWLRDHYMDTVSECVQQIVADFREVRFISTGIAPAMPGMDPVEKDAPRRRPARPSVRRFEGFNPRYTFDQFVVGSANRFAYAAARAVADSPGRGYNPLFLHGDTGLGKTHLMQAIGQEILDRDPNNTVVFISSEDFTNQLIESIAKKTTQRFRAKFRKVDALLIDDIHFIAGREATQEEFFHTFNALFDMHKQIVISSDRQPKEIRGLEERLISRFEWGLVTDIQPPDLETRVAILQCKAAQENVTVPPDVLRYVALHVTKNIRELEGALITVLAYSKLTGQKLGLPLVEEVLRDMIGRDKLKPVTMEAVQRAVAERFDVRIADLRGRSRQRQVAFPRQIAMYLCKALIPSLSLNEIGEAFGGKDHTTVIYACQKIAQENTTNPTTRQVLSQLERTLRSG